MEGKERRSLKMKLVYPAIFTPCIEKCGYTVEVPDLPGSGNILSGRILIRAQTEGFLR